MLTATLSYHVKTDASVKTSAASVFYLFPIIIGAKLLDQ
jgi:hypothetical protein